MPLVRCERSVAARFAGRPDTRRRGSNRAVRPGDRSVQNCGLAGGHSCQPTSDLLKSSQRLRRGPWFSTADVKVRSIRMIWLTLAAAVLTWGLTAGYIKAMTARGRLDEPNHRSMHVTPKPSGSGIVAVPVILLLWWLSAPVPGDMNRALIPCALLLSVVGWMDDIYRLPASKRL